MQAQNSGLLSSWPVDKQGASLRMTKMNFLYRTEELCLRLKRVDNIIYYKNIMSNARRVYKKNLDKTHLAPPVPFVISKMRMQCKASFKIASCSKQPKIERPTVHQLLSESP